MIKYKVTFMRFDESGRPFTQRVEGYLEMEDDRVHEVSGMLNDIIERGDTIADVKRKLRPPYFRIEQANESSLN